MIMVSSFYSVQYMIKFLPFPFFPFFHWAYQRLHCGTHFHSRSTNTVYLCITYDV